MVPDAVARQNAEERIRDARYQLMGVAFGPELGLPVGGRVELFERYLHEYRVAVADHTRLTIVK